MSRTRANLSVLNRLIALGLATVMVTDPALAAFSMTGLPSVRKRSALAWRCEEQALSARSVSVVTFSWDHPPLLFKLLRQYPKPGIRLMVPDDPSAKLDPDARERGTIAIRLSSHGKRFAHAIYLYELMERLDSRPFRRPWKAQTRERYKQLFDYFHRYENESTPLSYTDEDIRTYHAAVIEMQDLLSREVAAGLPRESRWALGRATWILGDLRDLLEGKNQAPFVDVPLSSVIQDAYKEAFTGWLLQRGVVTLHVDQGTSGSIHVAGDQEKIHSIFLGLFQNAYDVWRERQRARITAGEEETASGSLDFNMVIHSPAEDRSVLIEIADNAGGVQDPTLLARPDPSVDRQAAFYLNVTRRAGGTGLGLAEVWHWVRLHDRDRNPATIRLENDHGPDGSLRGARFFIRLPEALLQTPAPVTVELFRREFTFKSSKPLASQTFAFEAIGHIEQVLRTYSSLEKAPLRRKIEELSALVQLYVGKANDIFIAGQLKDRHLSYTFTQLPSGGIRFAIASHDGPIYGTFIPGRKGAPQENKGSGSTPGQGQQRSWTNGFPRRATGLAVNALLNPLQAVRHFRGSAEDPLTQTASRARHMTNQGPVDSEKRNESATHRPPALMEDHDSSAAEPLFRYFQSYGAGWPFRERLAEPLILRTPHRGISVKHVRLMMLDDLLHTKRAETSYVEHPELGLVAIAEASHLMWMELDPEAKGGIYAPGHGDCHVMLIRATHGAKTVLGHMHLYGGVDDAARDAYKQFQWVIRLIHSSGSYANPEIVLAIDERWHGFPRGTTLEKLSQEANDLGIHVRGATLRPSNLTGLSSDLVETTSLETPDHFSIQSEGLETQERIYWDGAWGSANAPSGASASIPQALENESLSVLDEDQFHVDPSPETWDPTFNWIVRNAEDMALPHSRFASMSDTYVIRAAIANAMDAVIMRNPASPSEFSGMIHLRVEESPDFIQLVISDNGVGIEKETLQKLFLAKGSHISTKRTKEWEQMLFGISGADVERWYSQFVRKDHGDIIFVTRTRQGSWRLTATADTLAAPRLESADRPEQGTDVYFRLRKNPGASRARHMSHEGGPSDKAPRVVDVPNSRSSLLRRVLGRILEATPPVPIAKTRAEIVKELPDATERFLRNHGVEDQAQRVVQVLSEWPGPDGTIIEPAHRARIASQLVDIVRAKGSVTVKQKAFIEALDWQSKPRSGKAAGDLIRKLEHELLSPLAYKGPVDVIGFYTAHGYADRFQELTPALNRIVQVAADQSRPVILLLENAGTTHSAIQVIRQKGDSEIKKVMHDPDYTHRVYFGPLHRSARSLAHRQVVFDRRLVPAESGAFFAQAIQDWLDVHSDVILVPEASPFEAWYNYLKHDLLLTPAAHADAVETKSLLKEAVDSAASAMKTRDEQIAGRQLEEIVAAYRDPVIVILFGASHYLIHQTINNQKFRQLTARLEELSPFNLDPLEWLSYRRRSEPNRPLSSTELELLSHHKSIAYQQEPLYNDRSIGSMDELDNRLHSLYRANFGDAFSQILNEESPSLLPNLEIQEPSLPAVPSGLQFHGSEGEVPGQGQHRFFSNGFPRRASGLAVDALLNPLSVVRHFRGSAEDPLTQTASRARHMTNQGPVDPKNKGQVTMKGWPESVSAPDRVQAMSAEEAIAFLKGKKLNFIHNAAYLSNRAQRDPWMDVITAITLRSMRPGQRSLHLGTGMTPIPVVEAIMGFHVTAIDICDDIIAEMSGQLREQGILSEIERRGGSLRWDVVDVQQWDSSEVLSGLFDHITAIDFHFARTAEGNSLLQKGLLDQFFNSRAIDYETLFGHLVQVAKPGGTILFGVLKTVSDWALHQLIDQGKKRDLIMTSAPIHGDEIRTLEPLHLIKIEDPAALESSTLENSIESEDPFNQGVPYHLLGTPSDRKIWKALSRIPGGVVKQRELARKVHFDQSLISRRLPRLIALQNQRRESRWREWLYSNVREGIEHYHRQGLVLTADQAAKRLRVSRATVYANGFLELFTRPSDYRQKAHHLQSAA